MNEACIVGPLKLVFLVTSSVELCDLLEEGVLHWLMEHQTPYVTSAVFSVNCMLCVC